MSDRKPHPDKQTLDSTPVGWKPSSWTRCQMDKPFTYPDLKELEAARTRLAQLPPLVTSGEIEKLRDEIALAQIGKRFILQGGDCAEMLAECSSAPIANKLKILLQMSLVMIHGLRMPVTRVGRFAGQYAKPRSSPTETKDVEGQPCTLPSYFGDLVNQIDFNEQSRTPDPFLMVEGYKHAALTLNFIRSLLEGGFADLHHPEYWDLSFFNNASVSDQRRAQYEQMSRTLADGLSFMENLGEQRVEDSSRVDFYTSHEGLNLFYEQAQTRQVPRRQGYYDLTTHLPWIGERNRQLDGPHIEFFKGIVNPVGVKVGPTMQPDELIELIDALNPSNIPGKLVLIARMGAGKVADHLPPLLDRVKTEGRTVLWMVDPMHGNGTTTSSGIKTRIFDDILKELEATVDAHDEADTILGGVHFELTGEDVTECLGGGSGITEADLSKNYVSLCDPRLNYQQSLELAFLLTSKLGQS
ncbi:MAG: 3-deoxy-7-phosphoheptulonate synthase class II [Phycisphaerales bacterium]|nr:3-deoxy-7-phosphoheptulonate synthase class II [Phycisphaerales bacterium]